LIIFIIRSSLEVFLFYNFIAIMFVGELYNIELIGASIILQIIENLLNCDLEKITPDNVLIFNIFRKWILKLLVSYFRN